MDFNSNNKKIVYHNFLIKLDSLLNTYEGKLDKTIIYALKVVRKNVQNKKEEEVLNGRNN